MTTSLTKDGKAGFKKTRVRWKGRCHLLRLLIKTNWVVLMNQTPESLGSNKLLKINKTHSCEGPEAATQFWGYFM